MSSVLIKKKVEVYTLGRVKKVMCIKESSKEEKEMARVLSGGQMAVGMKGSSEMESKVDGEYSSDREVTDSTKVTGIMACLMARELSTSRTDKDMKVLLRKISSMEKECFTKMIQLSMEFGKIMNCQWSTW